MHSAFSARTNWDMEEGSLAAAIRAAKDAGQSVCNLTQANPTLCGFDYDIAATTAPLSNVASLRYDPDPRGLHSARSAVSSYYSDHGASVSHENVILTTSTSEAYSFLLRLLCDSGDEIMVAQPGYPLFDYVATLHDVRLKYYNLFYDFGWWIDLHSLEREVGPRTRAIILVHPNNPTGHPTSAAQRSALEDFCQRHRLSLIVDEVFLDFSFAETIPSFASGNHPIPTFVVSGISKIAALPQMKVGWISAFGPTQMVRDALRRLEVIADTFLSLNTPVQLALPAWLQLRHDIQKQIMNRMRRNLQAFASLEHVTVLPVLAGWSAILRLPAFGQSTELAETLIREVSVQTHPGSFYGISERQRLVVSLIVQTQVFTEGLAALNRWCKSRTSA